ncbi:hypothetical protein Pcinc_027975 [Petrolisthes cinctipes]|uniref:ER-bound oxygenase mpaB/mpaB'/Rubber oxygenase catalytic domain-containing protein n=1 Tax=Petrolisthes cinctipes TaxID=88211 RepID=A0AAE1F3Y9_PETCI|nr:hypothetical protein Pcinc_027975 [Petrolisthes cinctipes]
MEEARVWLREELLGTGKCQQADCGYPPLPPPWLNPDKLRRGQQYFHVNFLSVFVSNLVGLLCLLTVPNILQILRSTQRSSTPITAYRRYLATLTHVKLWYSEDVFNPQSRAFKSIQQVRQLHSSAFRSSSVTQTDMVLTQWAFFGLVVTRGRQLGLTYTREEEEGLVHFWRAVGYLLGIEDRFNLCAGEMSEVRERCKVIQERVMAPGLISPPPHCATMTDALLQGVHRITPPMDPDALTAFAHSLFDIKPPCDLSYYSSVTFSNMVWIFECVFHLPVVGHLVRWWVNMLLNLNLNICNHHPSIVAFMMHVEKYILFLIPFFVNMLKRSVRKMINSKLKVIALCGSRSVFSSYQQHPQTPDYITTCNY